MSVRMKIGAAAAVVVVMLIGVVIAVTSSPGPDPYDAPKPEDAAWAAVSRERDEKGQFMRPRDYERLVEKAETIKTHQVVEHGGITLVFITFEQNRVVEREVHEVTLNGDGNWVLSRIPWYKFDTGDAFHDKLRNDQVHEWKHGR